jgi:hypothetical protein
MDIPEYIIRAAKEYSGGKADLFDAFIAGFKATRQPKAKNITMTIEQEQLFEESWECYGRKGNKAQAKKVWSEIAVSTLPIIMAHIKAYVASRERRFTKDFERYLRDGEYKNIVFNGNSVAFDPRQFDDANEYHPLEDGIFQTWDSKRKCLLFNGFIDQLNDGYTVDNRPDGATVAWQMYSWKWSKERKEWIKQMNYD